MPARSSSGKRRPSARNVELSRRFDPQFPDEVVSPRLKRALVRAGEHDRAADAADRLARTSSMPASLYDLACVLSLSAASASRDPKLPLPVGEKLAEQHSRRAIILLERTAKAGFFRSVAKVAHL